MITQKVKIYQMRGSKELRTARVLMSEDLRAVRYGGEFVILLFLPRPTSAPASVMLSEGATNHTIRTEVAPIT